MYNDTTRPTSQCQIRISHEINHNLVRTGVIGRGINTGRMIASSKKGKPEEAKTTKTTIAFNNKVKNEKPIYERPQNPIKHIQNEYKSSKNEQISKKQLKVTKQFNKKANEYVNDYGSISERNTLQYILNEETKEYFRNHHLEIAIRNQATKPITEEERIEAVKRLQKSNQTQKADSKVLTPEDKKVEERRVASMMNYRKREQLFRRDNGRIIRGKISLANKTIMAEITKPKQRGK